MSRRTQVLALRVIELGRYVVTSPLLRGEEWQVRYGSASGPVIGRASSRVKAVGLARSRELEARRVDRWSAREARRILGGAK